MTFKTASVLLLKTGPLLATCNFVASVFVAAQMEPGAPKKYVSAWAGVANAAITTAAAVSRIIIVGNLKRFIAKPPGLFVL